MLIAVFFFFANSLFYWESTLQFTTGCFYTEYIEL